jgi:6-phosphogluconate dehydrogenase
MGGNMVRRLIRAGHTCVVYDRSAAAVAALAAEGPAAAGSLSDFVAKLNTLERGDTLIDGGNSHYQDDIARAARLASRGLHYIDMGTSGGVSGLDRGYCLMIGGEPDVIARLDPLFAALAPGPGSIARTPGIERSISTAEQGYLHCGPAGAGHFVKMVHNGIEYGLMAAYAEGLNILHHANLGKAQREHDAETTPLRNPEHYQYEFDLAAISEVWRRGSVITSWLLDLTAAAFVKNPTLDGFSGHVADSGEGRWALQAANDEGVPAHVLAAALFERFASRGEDEFQNRVLSAMRLEFGGHQEKTGKKTS